MPRTKGSKNKHTNSVDKTSTVEVTYTTPNGVKTEMFDNTNIPDKNPWIFNITDPFESIKGILTDIVNGDYDKQELLDRINSML